MNNIKILDFYTEGCSPCKTMKPILEQFPNVEFINAMEDFDRAMEYNIRKAPTVIFLKDGAETHRFSGIKSKDEIQEIIDNL